MIPRDDFNIWTDLSITSNKSCVLCFFTKIDRFWNTCFWSRRFHQGISYVLHYNILQLLIILKQHHNKSHLTTLSWLFSFPPSILRYVGQNILALNSNRLVSNRQTQSVIVCKLNFCKAVSDILHERYIMKCTFVLLIGIRMVNSANVLAKF